jgi:DNA-directed RNA polymerase beta' subunit
LKITLLDINRYIVSNKLKEVKNSKVSSKGFDPQSIWSIEIFGSVGSKQRKETFAYIDLKTKVIHPNCYSMVKTCGEAISRLLDRKLKYIVEQGVLKESITGDNGLGFLIENFDKIDFTKNCKKDRLSTAKYIEDNKSTIVIDKFLVIPAGYRDMDISKFGGIQVSSDLNNAYKDLIYTCSKLSGIPDIDNILIDSVQNAVNNIVVWMQNSMKGKQGILRGSMLKKRMDYTSRLVASTDQNMPIGHVGIPWHTALAIFEPLFSYYVFQKDPSILEDIAKFIQKPQVDFASFLKFIQDFTALPGIVPENLKQKLIIIANEVVKDQQILVKRDPVLMRNNWFAATPIITDGQVAVINGLDIGPLDGDFDGDAVAIVPVFTEEAKKDAREKMNPNYSKSKWFSTMNNTDIIYNLSLDAIASIFNATKG